MKTQKGGARSWNRMLSALAIGAVLFGTIGTAAAVEVGKPAPHFDLPATTGVNISLKELLGKGWVLIEFYGADFAPT